MHSLQSSEWTVEASELYSQKPRLALFLLAHKLHNFSRNEKNCCKLSMLVISFSFSTDHLSWCLSLHIDINVTSILVKEDTFTQSHSFPLQAGFHHCSNFASSLSWYNVNDRNVKEYSNFSLCAVNYYKTMTAVWFMNSNIISPRFWPKCFILKPV